MHYLIQKTTRQHIAVADDMPCPVECVKVRADDEGWVKYRGERCPVPLRSRVDVVGVNGEMLNGKEARGIVWSAVVCYRPECDTISTAFDTAGREFADPIMGRAGETIAPPPTTERAYTSTPRSTAPAHETAAMLLCIICAFALGALIGWGWM